MVKYQKIWWHMMKWWNSSRCKPKVGFIYTIDSDFAILSGLWEEHFYTWPRWIQANIKQSKIPKSFGRTQTVFQSSKLSTYNQESSRGLTKNEVSSYFHCLFVMCSCIWSMQERRPYSKNGHCFMINISSNWMSSRIMAHLQLFFPSRNHLPSLWPSNPKIQVIQAVKFFIPQRLEVT